MADGKCAALPDLNAPNIGKGSAGKRDITLRKASGRKRTDKGRVQQPTGLRGEFGDEFLVFGSESSSDLPTLLLFPLSTPIHQLIHSGNEDIPLCGNQIVASLL